jgi:hypothetical protein
MRVSVDLYISRNASYACTFLESRRILLKRPVPARQDKNGKGLGETAAIFDFPHNLKKVLK